MTTETPELDAAAVGRDIGLRAPAGLPPEVLAETLRTAIAAAIPVTQSTPYPRKPRMWPWWLGYAGLWGVVALLARIESTGGRFPSEVRVLLGMLALGLVLATFVLLVVGRALKSGHASKIAAIDAVSQAAADSIRETALNSAWEMANRPSRIAPKTTLRPTWPRPAPQPYGVSHQGAEELAAGWMRHLGADDAVVTQFSGDGGIDVVSSRCIAQVKNLAPGSAVPVAQIRELAGVAAHDGRTPVFFTSGSYSAGGVEFADRAKMALFIYDAPRGTLSSANGVAHVALQHGLHPRI
ncbi:restriction endonuclease [Agromyces sp. NPDC058104]|uniref:restriction endonuclease n=1 Tax=Agromyces sp. NPDC058104 TaxID=3346342 RepID=UPI0036DEDF4F